MIDGELDQYGGKLLIRKPMAEEILDLNELWNKTDKETIANNVDRVVTMRFPRYDNTERIAWLMRMTNSGKHTIHAWFNRSRENVKIPLLKLCIIADELNIDVTEFLK